MRRGSTSRITDDWPLAQAFVIISAVPAGKALSRLRQPWSGRKLKIH